MGAPLCAGLQGGSPLLLERGLLGYEHFFEGLIGGGDHLVQLILSEGLAFGGSLDFDEASVGEADDIAVDIGG